MFSLFCSPNLTHRIHKYTQTNKHIPYRPQSASGSRITLTSPDPSYLSTDADADRAPTIRNDSHIVTFSAQKYTTQTQKQTDGQVVKGTVDTVSLHDDIQEKILDKIDVKHNTNTDTQDERVIDEL